MRGFLTFNENARTGFLVYYHDLPYNCIDVALYNPLNNFSFRLCGINDKIKGYDKELSILSVL